MILIEEAGYITSLGIGSIARVIDVLLRDECVVTTFPLVN